MLRRFADIQTKFDCTSVRLEVLRGDPATEECIRSAEFGLGQQFDPELREFYT